MTMKKIITIAIVAIAMTAMATAEPSNCPKEKCKKENCKSQQPCCKDTTKTDTLQLHMEENPNPQL